MHWQLLGASLAIATFLAFGLVKGVLFFGMSDQMNLVIPLLPILYGLIYPILERTRSSQQLKGASGYSAPRSGAFSGGLTLIAAGAVASVAAHVFIELAAWGVHKVWVLGQPIPGIHQLDAAWLGLLVRGELVPLEGAAKLWYLSLQMFLVSAFGGLCIGMLSPGNPMPTALIAGAIVAMWMGVNQYSGVLELFSDLSQSFADKAGVEWNSSTGLLIGLFMQTTLFAVWSGIAYRYRFGSSN